nr:U3 small nucleolar RNA-associated protein 25 isoform [Cryptomonas curvata]
MNKKFFNINKKKKNQILLNFFYKKFRYKINFKKKKIKCNHINKLLTPRRKIKLKFFSIFNIVEFEKLFKTVFSILALCIRNIVSIYYIKKTSVLISYNSYIFSSEMFLPSLYLSNNLMLFLESSLENSEQIRKSFINIMISNINQNYPDKTNTEKLNNQNCYPKFLVLIPNQTSLIQIIRILFDKSTLKKYQIISSNKIKFKSNDFLKIKNGKLLYPADKRIYSSDGQKDLIELGIKIKKNFLIFKSKIEKSDIAILTPLKIYKFSKEKSYLLLSNLRVCFVDDLSKLCMLNFEIILNVLKKLILSNKRRISLLEKNSNSIKNFFFQFFIFSNVIFKENFSILDNLSKNNFYLFYWLYKKRYIPASRKIRYKLYKFITKSFEKISKKRYIFFIRYIFLFLKLKMDDCLLIFFQNYIEYALIRNFIWKFKEIGKIEIIDLNEYIKPNQNSSFNNKFLKNKRNIVLLTERFYFFNRYILENFSKIIFYNFPSNWEFYFEICSFIYNIDSCNVYLILHFSDVDRIKKIFCYVKAQEIIRC